MNITGSWHHYDRNSYYNSVSGAFTVGDHTGDHDIRDWSSRVYGYSTISFNASRSWTGETSAVGGGESHTHGIKMKTYNYLIYKFFIAKNSNIRYYYTRNNRKRGCKV